jgi:hypothetical protein
MSGKSLSPSRDSQIFIPCFTFSARRRILCLYTSFPTASATILRDSTTETPDPISHENTLENFERITFCITEPKTGIEIRILS